jgi:hypothetical protein
VQEIEKLLSPAVEMVTSSEPLLDVFDVQSAEQDEALDEDHVRVEVLSNKTDVGLADRFTIGGLGGVWGSLPPPPPPPPPQETRNTRANKKL